MQKIDVVVRISGTDALYLRPDHSTDVFLPSIHGAPASYWMNRGVSWVTTMLYDSQSLPRAIRIVNVSKASLILSPHTVLAHVLTPGYFPDESMMVHLASNRYNEMQILAKEGRFTPSHLHPLARQASLLSQQYGRATVAQAAYFRH